MAEKGGDVAVLGPAFENSDGKASDEAQIGEVGDLYDARGDKSKYGDVKRGLNGRQVQFMAIGGTIGTGLFVGIGTALTRAGPLSMLLGFSITGMGVFAMLQCLGEMVTYLPIPGAIPHFGARYVDEALGFALGWNLWYSGAIAVCTDISAAAVIIQYWDDSINPAVWITIIIVCIVILNFSAVGIFGEVEFVFASIKVVTMLGLLILALCIDLGGAPNHHRLGFQYWKNPGAMKEYKTTGDLGRFLGLFATLITAAFSYGGIEAVAVIAGEAENPRKNMPKAIRRLFWRIIIFYVLGSLAIGVMVPYNDKKLITAQQKDLPGAARSPWVVAIEEAGIPVLPSIINAVILSSAASASNQFVYVSSRYMLAMAQKGHAPRFFLHCNKAGVPYYCVGITTLMMAITYLSVNAQGTTAFNWLSNLTTTSGLLTWATISFTYTRFYYALKAQGIDRNTLPLKTPFQPYLAYISCAFFLIIVIFCGFGVFIKGSWSVSGFLTYYLNVPIFFGLYFGYKVIMRTKIHPLADIDLVAGKAVIEAEDAQWTESIPRNIFEKIWFWIT